ncbi:hypothetical protein PAAL109150_16610 [Paenibacillus alkaliterrae]
MNAMTYLPIYLCCASLELREFALNSILGRLTFSFSHQMFVFAGNNGSGKSTIRNLIIDRLGVSANVDPERGFLVETTLAGGNVIRQMCEAKDNGFEVIMFYVGLGDYRLNIDRVAARVKNGGHDIPAEDMFY